MAKKIKKSVGLVVATKMSGRYCFVLQKRGEFNPETMKAESYPGVCQVTLHGGLDGQETFKQALTREAKEELGINFQKLLKKNLKKIFILNENKTNKSHIITYGLILANYKFIPKITLGPASGGIKLFNPKDIKTIKKTTEYKRLTGIKNGCIIAMFPDDIESIKKFITILTQKKQ